MNGGAVAAAAATVYLFEFDPVFDLDIVYFHGYHIEMTRKYPIGSEHAQFEHGETHRTKEWTTWWNMLARCTYPSVKVYPRYGGRGITVCDRWATSYPAFLADMGRAPSPKHSIDRIDNDSNYEPGNCRWATQSEQVRNSTTAHPITAFGRTMLLTDWAKETGVKRRTIQMRLVRGWSAEDAVS